MRFLFLLAVVTAQLSRVSPLQAAESSQFLDTPLADAELQRGLDARVSVATPAVSLHLYTAGDLLARTTALGYGVLASFVDGGRDAECNLHDGACAGGGVAIGLEIYGALGDSEASLHPMEQAHVLSLTATIPLFGGLLHAGLAAGLLEENWGVQTLFAAEF